MMPCYQTRLIIIVFFRHLIQISMHLVRVYWVPQSSIVFQCHDISQQTSENHFQMQTKSCSLPISLNIIMTFRWPFDRHLATTCMIAANPYPRARAWVDNKRGNFYERQTKDNRRYGQTQSKSRTILRGLNHGWLRDDTVARRWSNWWFTTIIYFNVQLTDAWQLLFVLTGQY